MNSQLKSFNRDVAKYNSLMAQMRARSGITIKQAIAIEDAKRRLAQWAVIGLNAEII